MEVVLIGASAGGWNALNLLLPSLPADFPVPVVVVQHVHASQEASWVGYLDDLCALKVKEAEDKEPLALGVCYFAPPDYHLLIERDRTASLSRDEKVHYSRPSIDVLFESAAMAYGPEAVAVILSGASRDGAAGLAAIRANGGVAVIQDPFTAEFPCMPQAALDVAGADYRVSVEEMGSLLAQCVRDRAVCGKRR